MLLLERVRLVNWHYFQDETVELDKTTLIAGDNGSGKSTLLDALQYALVADIRKVKFNAAASGLRTERTLEGYARCKIGAAGRDYYRDDTVSHIILQFSRLGVTFCAGAVVEAFRDGQVRDHFWILEGGRLDDLLLIENKRMVPVNTFKGQLKKLGGTVCSAGKQEYINRLTKLLGVYRRTARFNPYLEALVRSVSFVPLESVNSFVSQYILEERQIDISAMKENLSNYREAQLQAETVRLRIGQLEKIESIQESVDQLREQILQQQYLYYRLEFEIGEQQLVRLTAQIEAYRSEAECVQHALEQGAEDEERLQQQVRELELAMEMDDSRRAWRELERQRETVQRDLSQARERAAAALRERSQCEALLGRALDPDLHTELQKLEEARDSAISSRQQAVVCKEALEAEQADLLQEEHELSRGLLRYPETVRQLKDALTEAGIEVWITAELLEVVDPEWQNAVEGWLNTNRFCLLVKETDFRSALEVYNRQPKKIAGVGIPRLEAMHSSEIRLGSLAEMVEAESPLARRYIARQLGDVMISSLEQLKTHRKAVTKDCMKYSNHTAFRIKPEVYERWYIGRKAREQRLQAVQEGLERCRSELQRLQGEISSAEQQSGLFRRAVHSVYKLQSLGDAPGEVERLLKIESDISEQLAAIDTGSWDELRIRQQAVEQQLVAMKQEQMQLQRRSGELNSELRHAAGDQTRLQDAVQIRGERYRQFLGQYRRLQQPFEQYYRSRLRKSVSLEEREALLGNYESNRKGLETRLQRRRDELSTLKANYNAVNNVLLSVDDDDSVQFLEQLTNYRNTDLPAYEEKIIRARKEAEQQFRDHFVARLNEYLTDARDSFKELNRILKGLSFGQDSYRFHLEARREKKALLEVIQEAAHIEEWSDTMFAGTGSGNRSIEELFNRILEADGEDDPEVKDVCDYRTYFDYDIYITHRQTLDEESGEPLVTSLSRTLRQKSGGESQTPYYVAIAASFFRFFKDEPDAVRLVLFDEAFNKMDDDRISKMLNFFRSLGMQIVTAVPTEKIETVGPGMDRINLVFRRDYRAFVRSYAAEQEGNSDDSA